MAPSVGCTARSAGTTGAVLEDDDEEDGLPATLSVDGLLGVPEHPATSVAAVTSIAAATSRRRAPRVIPTTATPVLAPWGALLAVRVLSRGPGAGARSTPSDARQPRLVGSLRL
ncbi:hypothetical protein GCM10027517_06290 [Phycicoccus ginsengisoli]